MLTLLSIVTTGLLAATAYVCAGYPLLMAVWARLARRPVAVGDITPTVSFIIAAYNEAGVISEKIRNTLALDYPHDRLQIIVVADGSSDMTAALADGFAEKGVVVLFEPRRRGKSAALNRAVAISTGEILVFSDANAFYERDAVRKLARNFADPDVGCVSGAKSVRRGSSETAGSEGFYWRYESFLRKIESASGSTVGVVGEINAIRRPLYATIPEHIINDDAYLALATLRGGMRVLYEPAARSMENAAQSLGEELVRRRRIVAGRFQQLLTPSLWLGLPPGALFRLVSHKFLRLALPLLMGGAFVCNALVLLFDQPPRVLVATFLMQVAGYGLALAGMPLRYGAGWSRVPAAAYFVVASNLAVLGGLRHFLNGQATALWKKPAR